MFCGIRTESFPNTLQDILRAQLVRVGLGDGYRGECKIRRKDSVVVEIDREADNRVEVENVFVGHLEEELLDFESDGGRPLEAEVGWRFYADVEVGKLTREEFKLEPRAGGSGHEERHGEQHGEGESMREDGAKNR